MPNNLGVRAALNLARLQGLTFVFNFHSMTLQEILAPALKERVSRSANGRHQGLPFPLSFPDSHISLNTTVRRISPAWARNGAASWCRSACRLRPHTENLKPSMDFVETPRSTRFTGGRACGIAS